MESLDDKINVLKGNNSQHRGNIKSPFNEIDFLGKSGLLVTSKCPNVREDTEKFSE